MMMLHPAVSRYCQQLKMMKVSPKGAHSEIELSVF